MTTEVKVPPMVDHKNDAGSDWFFCDGCLAYHPPEYQGEFQSNYKKYCHFALSIIREQEIPVDDTPLTSICQTWNINDKAVKLSYPIETTCIEHSESVNFTRKKRALRKELPEDEIRASTETSRVLAHRYGVSHTLIANIKKGQRVLV